MNAKGGKYVCPSRRNATTTTTTTLSSASTKKEPEQSQLKASVESIKDFPSLAPLKKCGSEKNQHSCSHSTIKNIASDTASTTALNYVEAIHVSAEQVAQKRAIQQEIQNNKEKIERQKKIMDGRKKSTNQSFPVRTYDSEGWMTNEDWLFWFEHYHPNLIGRF